MKILALLIGISTCVSACNQQETNPVPQVPVASTSGSVPQVPVAATSGSVPQVPVAATSGSVPQPLPDPHSEKKVCIRVYDAKEKQQVEKCQTSKVYQKHQGVPIPAR